MTRVTGAKTRQAILVLGGSTNPYEAPERLELFDQNGDPINLSGAVGIPGGGLTNQRLAKVSDDAYDVAWVDNPPAGPQLLDEGVLKPRQPFWDLVGPGVIITDDPANEKSIISIPGAAVGDVKSVLAALASGDKMAWELGGADFAEIYGIRVPTGYASVYLADFSTDTSAHWTPIFSGSVTVSGGVAYASNGDYLRNVNAGAINGTVPHKVRCQLVAVGAAWQSTDYLMMDIVGPLTTAIMWRTDATNHLVLYFQGGGVSAVTGGVIGAPQVGAWMELEHNGDTIIARYFSAGKNPDVDAADVTVTKLLAPGSESAAFGSGSPAGYPGFFGHGSAWKFDNFQVFTAQPEARDLWVAITSDSGGIRTARKLLRKDGLSEIGHTVLDGLTTKTQRPKLAFSGLLVTDDATNERTTVAPLKYAADLGAITASTPLTVTHNLNTKDVSVTVYRISDGVEDTTVVKTRNGVNTVLLTFSASFAANVYRVVVNG